MGRKLILLILLCMVSTGILFASNSSIHVGASPYSYQLIAMAGDSDSYSSYYGWGMDAGYRYNMKNLNVGLDVSYSRFKYEDLSEDYKVLSILAKVGAKVNATESFFFDVNFGAGTDVRFLDDEAKANFAMALYTGCGYQFDEHLAVTGGVDLKFGPQSNEDSSLDSADFAIVTKLGVKVGL